MTILFIILIITLFWSSKIYIKNNNENYLSKNQTTIMNGLFVLLVFYRHFFSYVSNVNQLDIYLVYILDHIKQLIVTSFLFYSGYGICESLKKKANYRKTFFIKRFLPTFTNFSIAIVLFIIVNFMMNNKVSNTKIILSFIGWESIGNSNWYMFAIFCEYLFLMISFQLFKKTKSQMNFLTIFTFIFIIVVARYKESHWVNTILCFPFGMYFSYYKDRIEKVLFNRKKTNKIIFLVLLLFILLYFTQHFTNDVFVYNIISISFILLIVLLSLKIELKSKIFQYIGNRVFWIYILQRIPMILLKDQLNNQLYFVVCLIITLCLSEVMYRTTNKINSKIYERNVCYEIFKK